MILFIAGVIAGALNAVAGGGSFISFPVMMFTGVPPVEANASNSVALWPGLATGVASYSRRLLKPRRLLAPFGLTRDQGGLAGA